MQTIVIAAVLIIVGIVVFINLIEIGVRNGINSSIIGQSHEKKNGINEIKEPLNDYDIDKGR